MCVCVCVLFHHLSAVVNVISPLVDCSIEKGPRSCCVLKCDLAIPALALCYDYKTCESFQETMSDNIMILNYTSETSVVSLYTFSHHQLL